MTHENVSTWVVPGGVSPMHTEGSGAELGGLYLSRAKGQNCPTLTLCEKATSSDSGMDLPEPVKLYLQRQAWPGWP